MAATRASTSAMVAVGRSGDVPLEAPRTRHGFLITSSSSTAVAKMACRSR
ncbi:MAG: hypothetical protein ABSF84_13950 [Acidimicrobiales bacterium]